MKQSAQLGRSSARPGGRNWAERISATGSRRRGVFSPRSCDIRDTSRPGMRSSSARRAGPINLETMTCPIGGTCDVTKMRQNRGTESESRGRKKERGEQRPAAKARDRYDCELAIPSADLSGITQPRTLPIRKYYILQRYPT